MPARIVTNGRVRFQHQELRQLERRQKLQRQAVPLGRKGTEHEGRPVGAAAIPADSPESPYRAGTAFFCDEDRVTYRVVRALDPREGWATTGFWQRRWRCKHQDVLALVERGHLDAAMEQGSQVRRYRCRDERLALKSDVLENAERRRAAYRERFRRKERA